MEFRRARRHHRRVFCVPGRAVTRRTTACGRIKRRRRTGSRGRENTSLPSADVRMTLCETFTAEIETDTAAPDARPSVQSSDLRRPRANSFAGEVVAENRRQTQMEPRTPLSIANTPARLSHSMPACPKRLLRMAPFRNMEAKRTGLRFSQQCFVPGGFLHQQDGRQFSERCWQQLDDYASPGLLIRDL
jgi:hypothetical protein